jgi:hypothetical protein
VRADEFGFVEHDKVIPRIFFDLRSLVLLAAIFDREMMKFEFLGEVEEVLARRIADINPHHVLLIQAILANICGRKVIRKLFRRAVETNRRDHSSRPSLLKFPAKEYTFFKSFQESNLSASFKNRLESARPIFETRRRVHP